MRLSSPGWGWGTGPHTGSVPPTPCSLPGPPCHCVCGSLGPLRGPLGKDKFLLWLRVGPESRDHGRQAWEGNWFQENHLVGIPERPSLRGSQELAILPPCRGGNRRQFGVSWAGEKVSRAQPRNPRPRVPLAEALPESMPLRSHLSITGTKGPPTQPGRSPRKRGKVRGQQCPRNEASVPVLMARWAHRDPE